MIQKFKKKMVHKDKVSSYSSSNETQSQVDTSQGEDVEDDEVDNIESSEESDGSIGKSETSDDLSQLQ